MEETGLELLSFEYMTKDVDGEIKHYLYKCQTVEGDVCLGGPKKRIVGTIGIFLNGLKQIRSASWTYIQR